jgi:hypothetical protein
MIAFACLVLLFLAAREPVIGLTFIQNLDTSAAVLFGIPALCAAQSILLMLSGHFARQRTGKAWQDRFPFSTLAWVRASRPHSTWLLLFLFYVFPLLTLVCLLVTLHGLHIVSFTEKSIDRDLSGLALYSFPSGFWNGETWWWCVNGCASEGNIPAIRRSAYPGLQPALYLLLSMAVGVQTARLMVYRNRG